MFLKECKKILLSIPYIIIAAILIVFFYTQFYVGINADLTAPQPDDPAGYGYYTQDDPPLIMPAATDSLFLEFLNNAYIAYPQGFYKNVTLSDSDQAQIAEILSKITGVPTEDFLAAEKEERESSSTTVIDAGEEAKAEDGSIYIIPNNLTEEDRSGTLDISVREDLSYEEFIALMDQADKIIGGESYYKRASLASHFGQMPKDYTQAMADYEALLENGAGVALSRLFSDYLGIFATLLPVFLAVWLVMKDRAARMNELVSTRQISSWKLIGVRYLALVCMVMLVVFVLAGITATSIYSICGAIDGLYMPFVFAIGWIMPGIMISASLGMILTVLTGTPAAIAVFGLWWFLSLTSNVSNIYGNYENFTLIPRHNTIENTAYFTENLRALAENRFFYVALSIVLVLFSMYIYEAKRRGRWHVSIIKQRSNHQIEFEE